MHVDPIGTDGAAAPAHEFDFGTLEGILLDEISSMGSAWRLSVGLPSRMRQQYAGGRYFLVRCGAQNLAERAENWQIYLRRALFVCGLQPQPVDEEDETGFDRWDLLLPDDDDPGHVWLRDRKPGESLNLMGLFGNGFSLAQEVRNLLILAEPNRCASLLPVINQMLDRNGRVTVVIHDHAGGNPTPLLEMLPLAVEVHLVQVDEQWRPILEQTVTWADQICAALPHAQFSTLKETIQRRRFRLEQDFAQILVQADLACGTGACLACVVPTANGGVTRACVHGPVLDLATLSG